MVHWGKEKQLYIQTPDRARRGHHREAAMDIYLPLGQKHPERQGFYVDAICHHKVSAVLNKPAFPGSN